MKDEPLQNAEAVWFAGGSSYVEESVRKTGWAVVNQSGSVTRSEALPPSCSVQHAELEAGLQDLQAAKGL